MRKPEGTVAQNEPDSDRDDILHIKCDVIKFIRDQINNIKDKPTRSLTKPAQEAARSPMAKPEREERRPCDNWGYLQCLALCLLLFLLFLYGAIVGANMCQTKTHGCHSLFPSLGLGQKSHQVIF